MAESPPGPQAAPVAQQRMPIGAALATPEVVHVCVWAPDHAEVRVRIDGETWPLVAEAGGYFSGEAPGSAGSRYGFLLGSDTKVYPDPASRAQPDGPHGLSEIIDPAAYRWQDAGWAGLVREPVLYELHLGTFTETGTCAAAMAWLDDLAELGVTVVQLMPLAEFPGAFGWGYDGVGLFAPSRLYGRPDDVRRFIDRAHALGLAVILDVVYNHVGPDGNYLRAFARDYFTDRYDNEWGDAFNFDGPNSAPVREWVLSNVAYWVREFHVDGFRLDATQQIFDASDEHLVAAIARTARQAAGTRRVLVTAENEPQHARLVEPTTRGGYGLDAIYNEDFHHSTRMQLVGTHEAYFSDYRGVASEWLACARWGALFQGQHYAWQRQPRGTPGLRLPRSTCVHFLENHDQVANTDRGRRLVDLARPADLRAMTALLLLLPAMPMLFQGQEFGSRRPFLYFADHEAPLCDAVAKGRRAFLEQFERLRDPAVYVSQPAPHDASAWKQSQLVRRDADPAEAACRALHRDLLRLRGERPRTEGELVLDGASPDTSLLLLRYFGDDDTDWLIVLNSGADRDVASLSEPLIAPPPARRWRHLWSSEAPTYGGHGEMTWSPGHWPVPGHSLMVLRAVALEDPPA